MQTEFSSNTHLLEYLCDKPEISTKSYDQEKCLDNLDSATISNTKKTETRISNFLNSSQNQNTSSIDSCKPTVQSKKSSSSKLSSIHKRVKEEQETKSNVQEKYSITSSNNKRTETTRSRLLNACKSQNASCSESDKPKSKKNESNSSRTVQKNEKEKQDEKSQIHAPSAKKETDTSKRNENIRKYNETYDKKREGGEDKLENCDRNRRQYGSSSDRHSKDDRKEPEKKKELEDARDKNNRHSEKHEGKDVKFTLFGKCRHLQKLYSVRGLERSELGGSHGCPGRLWDRFL